MQISAVLINKTLSDLTEHLMHNQPQFAALDQPAFFNEHGEVTADSLLTMQMLSYIAQLYHLQEQHTQAMLARPTGQHWSEIIHQWLQASDTAELTFMTSGTTGTPKVVTHCLDYLMQEVSVWAEQFKHIDVIYSLVPAHHIYGFIWTVLLPEMLDIPVVDCRNRLPMHFIEPGKRGLVVAIPDQISLLSTASAQQQTCCDLVLSTAPCSDAQLAVIAGQKWGAAAVIYGSTETAAIGLRWVTDNRFTLLPIIERRPDGLYRQGKCMTLQDELDWQSLNTFNVIRRLDGAKQFRGYNVDTQVLTQELLRHPKIEHATIELLAESSQLTFTLRCRSDAKQAISQWLQQEWPKHAQPTAIEWIST